MKTASGFASRIIGASTRHWAKSCWRAAFSDSKPQPRSRLDAEHRSRRERRNQLTTAVIDDRARGGGDADHEGTRRRRGAQRNATPCIQHRHFEHAAAKAEQRRYIAGHERDEERERKPLHAVRHDAATLRVVEPTAQQSRIDRCAGDGDALIERPQHQDRDDRHHHGKQAANRVFRKELRGDTPREAPRRRGYFQ